MNSFSFDSKRCERIRQHLDSYLSNELLVETAIEVVQHLENCQGCSRELDARIRVRDVLQRAVVSCPVPVSIRADVMHKLRDSLDRSYAVGGVWRWALDLAALET